MSPPTDKERGITQSQRSVPAISASHATVADQLLAILAKSAPQGSTDRYKAVEDFFSNRLSIAEAAQLYSQLSNPRDPLRRQLDYRLSHKGASKLVGILREKALVFVDRSISGAKSVARAFQTAAVLADDPPNHPRYIDNLFQIVKVSGLSGAFTFGWIESGQEREVTVSRKQFLTRPTGKYSFEITDERQTLADTSTIYMDKESAQRAAERLKAEFPNQAQLYYAYYYGPYGVILPTTLFPNIMPRFYSLVPDLSKDLKDNLTNARGVLLPLAGYVNRIPFTEIDEKGKLHLNIDPYSVLQAVLNLRSIHGLGGLHEKLPYGSSQLGRISSLIGKLGESEDVIKQIIGKNSSVLKSTQRLAEGGYARLLVEIAEEYKHTPKDGGNLLHELGKLSDKQLDGLDAIRDALAKTVIKKPTDWLEFFHNTPKNYRDELLQLIGEVRDVVDTGLAEAISRALRENPNDIHGSLGHFHAAVYLKEKYQGLHPNMRMDFEVPTFVQLAEKNELREVDIQLRFGQRKIDNEIKTHLKQISITNHVKQEFAKDLINHVDDRWENLQYLYSPNVKKQLGRVQRALLEALKDSNVRQVIRRTGLSLEDAEKLLAARIKNGLVEIYEWFTAHL